MRLKVVVTRRLRESFPFVRDYRVKGYGTDGFVCQMNGAVRDLVYSIDEQAERAKPELTNAEYGTAK